MTFKCQYIVCDLRPLQLSLDSSLILSLLSRRHGVDQFLYVEGHQELGDQAQDLSVGDTNEGSVPILDVHVGECLRDDLEEGAGRVSYYKL